MMKNSKTTQPRTLLGLTALVTATGLALTGCAGSAGEPGVTELTVQAWADAAQAEQWNAVFDAYTEANPDVRVTLDWMDVGSYPDKLATKFAAGDAPDVFFLNNNWIGEYISRGALLPLDEYSAQLDLSDIPPALLAPAQSEGTTYGVPGGSGAIGFVYNTDIVKQAGLALPDDTTWTWEDFGDLNTAIFDATDVYGTGYYVPWMPMLSVFARQHGEEVYTVDGELGISEATVQRYFEILTELRQTGGFAPAGFLESQGTSVAESPLGKGTIASQVIPANVFPDFDAAVGGALQLMRLPRESGGDNAGMQVSPTLLWSAASTSLHPEEAAKLIDFLTNDPLSFDVRGTRLRVPVNPEVAETVAQSLSPEQQMFVSYVQALIDEDLPGWNPEPAGAGGVANAFVSVATEVEFGRMTPAEAARKFVADARTELANAG